MIGVEDQAQRKKKGKKKRKKNKREIEEPQQRHKSYKEHGRNAQLFKNKTLQVKQRKIGLLIGRGGCHIKELYERTHCDIILPRPTKKPMNEAAEGLVSYEDDNADIYYQYDAYTDSVKTNVQIDDDYKKSEKKEKNKDDDDDDEDKDELDADDPERMVDVKLRGTPEELRDAEFEINFMIKNGRLMLESERDSGNVKTNKSSLSKKYENDDDDSDDCAEDIRIPSKICGMLIGGGGQRVKEISADSGCEIWVDWDKESHIEAGVSTVHLSGTPHSIELAKQQIRRIMELFEKRSHKIAFELPSFSSGVLFGEHGKTLKKLQQDYGVTITVRNDQNRNRYIRVGQEHQKVQSTMMIILIGEQEDSIDCKNAILSLVGRHRKCDECDYLTKESDGKMDEIGRSFYCRRCWDEFNGITQNYAGNKDVVAAANKMKNMNLNNNNNDNNRNKYEQNVQTRPPINHNNNHNQNKYDQSHNNNNNNNNNRKNQYDQYNEYNQPRRPPMRSGQNHTHNNQDPPQPQPSHVANYKYGYNKIDESQQYLGQQRRSRKVGKPSVERNNKW